MKAPAHLDSRAFTLMELMIVIAIVAVIAGFVIPSFAGYIHNQNLRQGRDKLMTDLRSIQNRALTGVDYAEDQLYWGVKFSENQSRYHYFTVNAADDTNGDDVIETVDLDQICNDLDTNLAEQGKPLLNDVILRSADTCVFFSFDNGGTLHAAGHTVSIGYDGNDDDCMDVNVNPAGRVDSPTVFDSCP